MFTNEYSEYFIKTTTNPTTIGGLVIWAFIDVFFIGSRIEELNDEIEAELIQNIQILTKQEQ